MQKKISFKAIKNCKKVEIVYVTTTSYNYYLTRGGVEETTFEAKAEDSKKIRCQGQEPTFLGQTFSRPRKGMVEAKAKDRGHNSFNYSRQIFHYFLARKYLR